MDRIKVIAAAEREPITLSEAKAHLRVDFDDDDTLLAMFIGAATGHCESFMGRALIAQTLDCYLDAFPSGKEIRLPRPPLIEVVGLFYTDAAGDEQEFTDFEVDTAREPGRIFIGPNTTWPTPIEQANAVRIRYRAGYVDTSVSPETGDVPYDIKAALLLTLGTLYAHRETVVIGQAASMLPWGAEQLMRRHRVELSAA